MAKPTTLGYGHDRLTLAGMPGACWGVLEPEPVPAPAPAADLVTRALAAPIGAPPFHTLGHPGQRAAILVSGRDRVTRADVFMPILVRQLRAAGLRPADITVHMATGTHLPFSAADRAAIFGPDFDADIPILPHDSRDAGRMIALGTSRFGNEIRVSRAAYEADLKILTGRLTHHYFAGFTAGRKAVLPGVAAFDTIQRNHRMVLSGPPDAPRHPRAANGCLDGNPIHEEMVEAAARFEPTFSLNTVLNAAHELTHVFCGDTLAAHAAGCAEVARRFEVPIPRPAPLVVASCGGAPYDCSFMQALKTIMNTAASVADGGVMLLIAQCPEGILPGFLGWKSTLSLPELAREVLGSYNLTGHNTYLLRETLQRIRVVLLSSCPPGQVEALGLIPADDLASAWSRATHAAGEAAPPCWVVPHGNVTVLRRCG